MAEISVPICGRCRKPIIDVMYAEVGAALVLQEYFEPVPKIFRAQESADNYAKRIPMHDTCWIDTLRDHGIPLNDMTEVLAAMQKKLKINEIEPKEEGEK